MPIPYQTQSSQTNLFVLLVKKLVDLFVISEILNYLVNYRHHQCYFRYVSQVKIIDRVTYSSLLTNT